QLADVDHRIDRDVAGVKAAINAALYSLDAAVVEAARQLHARLKEFGDLRAKSYEEESAAIQVLLGDFAGAYAQQVALVGLAMWVADLQAAEAEFTALFAQRNIELADRPQENLRDVRRQIEAVYHQITTCVDANIVLGGEATCGELARQLSEEVKYFNEHSHHHAKHDLHHAAVDSIADQPFAGKAVTPIPTVRYTDSKGATLELTFAKDFTLTYKDNDRAGTAEVIIHGKGAYKGAKVVTFNVASGRGGFSRDVARNVSTKARHYKCRAKA
ncbi:MAG: DUF6261 family protein, partial [Prevotellaceae bacterium]|nr:DUF6261 family protein [Prevotellaceae bacterium]